jgi:hypothetical protein
MTEFESQGGNVEALKAAGVVSDDLPAEFHEVFEGLSNQELAVLMLVKARLDGVQRRTPDVQDHAGFVAL